MFYALLYKLYFALNLPSNHFLIRIFLRCFDTLVPLYFRFNLLHVPSLMKSKDRGNSLIVSLTTFPDRIDQVHLVIEAMLRQTIQPDGIILWLSKTEFSVDYLIPQSLKRLEQRGLMIKWLEENLKPHKKYFYAFQEYPNSDIITVDDDEYYPVNLIENFVKYHQIYPETIIATRARKLRFENGKIANYNSFENISAFHKPDNDLIAIGCGGVFYPKGSLGKEIFIKHNIFEMALEADDLWLKFANNKHTQVMCIANEYRNKIFLPVYRLLKTPKLSEFNVDNCNNDKVIQVLLCYNHNQPETLH